MADVVLKQNSTISGLSIRGGTRNFYPPKMVPPDFKVLYKILMKLFKF
jgi:hypothetical protein